MFVELFYYTSMAHKITEAGDVCKWDFEFKLSKQTSNQLAIKSSTKIWKNQTCIVCKFLDTIRLEHESDGLINDVIKQLIQLFGGKKFYCKNDNLTNFSTITFDQNEKKLKINDCMQMGYYLKQIIGKIKNNHNKTIKTNEDSNDTYPISNLQIENLPKYDNLTYFLFCFQFYDKNKTMKIKSKLSTLFEKYADVTLESVFHNQNELRVYIIISSFSSQIKLDIYHKFGYFVFPTDHQCDSINQNIDNKKIAIVNPCS